MPMCRSPPFLSKNADKKEMEEIKCQKNITFMSTDKGLKSASRYIKYYWREKEQRKVFRAGGQEKPLALFYHWIMTDTL